ncbi:MAG: FtsX-like permease family protein, partial [Acidobacteriota bacterium]
VRIEPVVRAAIAPWARDGVTRGSALMMAAAVLVLLIVCANVANLLLARANERRKEIALRLALGIRRRRLIRQLLTESAVLALLAGVVGLFVARWMRDALLTLLGAIPMPYQATFGLELQLDPVVLGFLLLLALGCALVFGLVPALRSSRLDLVGALKQGEATRQGRHRKLGARNALVVAQVALSLVALVGAGLFLRSHTEARQIDPGFDTEKTLMVSFDLGLQGYTPTRGVQLYRSLVERVEALPGAVSAVMAQSAPLQWTMSRSVLIEQGESNDYDRSFVETNLVGPGYFETLGIVLEEGRGIRASDREGSQRVVVVNRTMADRFWPGRSALGQRFSFFGHPPVEVVGIARDAKYSHVGEAPMPFAYLALEQEYSSLLTLLVQSSGPAEALLPLVLRELRVLAPDLSLTQASTIEQVFSSTLWPSRIAAVFLVLFGVLALVLAAIGIYGVMSYAVYRRRRELGIRAALGAARGKILTMVLGESLQMVAMGLACGLLVAFWASRLVAAMLFVEATDPWAFIGALGVLVACALIATLVPALRALGAEPLSVLRHE